VNDIMLRSTVSYASSGEWPYNGKYMKQQHLMSQVDRHAEARSSSSLRSIIQSRHLFPIPTTVLWLLLLNLTTPP